MPYNTKGLLLYVILKLVLLLENLAINITAVHEKHNGQWRVPYEVQINIVTVEAGAVEEWDVLRGLDQYLLSSYKGSKT